MTCFTDGLFTNSLSNVNALLNWDTSKVKNMSSMFAGNFGLTDIEGLKKNGIHLTLLICIICLEMEMARDVHL